MGTQHRDISPAHCSTCIDTYTLIERHHQETPDNPPRNEDLAAELDSVAHFAAGSRVGSE
ncbi:hypothetical protein [Streptomyces sp. NPDC057910]|uniref:hypothetical protein n=1 Tax=Streptomyces sp. NPDC057910 TaxID=3346278 RepID=UPI0036E05CD6